MAITNPNITPDDGLVEGDVFQILMRPLDVDGNPVIMSAASLSIKNDDTTTVIDLAAFVSILVNTITYESHNLTVGPGKTQIQVVSTGDVIATDLAYIKATKKPI